MIQKNEELQGIRKNPYGRKFNEKIIEDVNSIEVFKDYHIDSNRFKEFQKDNSDYISFIEGILGKRKINKILLSYEKIFNTGYLVAKFKTT